MDEERKNELNEAVNEIARYNLWRRGRTDSYARREDYPLSLGESLDIVCGGVLDYLDLQKDFDRVVLERDRAVLENKNLRCNQSGCDEVIKKITLERDELESERNHFKALLAAFGIPHKRKQNKKKGK